MHFVSKFAPHDIDVISLQEMSVVEKTDHEEEEWRGLMEVTEVEVTYILGNDSCRNIF